MKDKTPRKPKGFRVEITGSRGCWNCRVWIDQQGFKICEDSPSKKRAEWYGKQFLVAIDRLIKNNTHDSSKGKASK